MGQKNLYYLAKLLPWVKSTAVKASQNGKRADPEDVESSLIGRMVDSKDVNSTTEFKGKAGAVARNAAIDQMRRKSKELEHAQTVFLVKQYIRHKGINLPNEAVENMVERLIMMGTGDRDAILLKLRGMTSKEIADMMGVKPSTVRDRQAKALNELREVFGDDSDHPRL